MYYMYIVAHVTNVGCGALIIMNKIIRNKNSLTPFLIVQSSESHETKASKNVTQLYLASCNRIPLFVFKI